MDIQADVALLSHHFPHLTEGQLAQYEALGELYPAWNDKINLISRKDITNLYPRHVLYSLAIAKIMSFQPGTTVLDVGTGGGFPGIPLAIMFPEVRFTLVDSIGKKIKVVTAVVKALGLNNVTPICDRAERVQGQYEFVVSRATAKLDVVYEWVRKKLSQVSRHPIPNGLLYLTGGDLSETLRHLHLPSRPYDLAPYFPMPFFQTKKLVHLYPSQR